MRKGEGDSRTRFFTRTVTTTVIKVGQFKDGAVTEMSEIVIPVRVTSQTAVMKEITAKYPNETGLFCIGTEYREETRRLSIDNFMKYSEVVGDGIESMPTKNEEK